MASFHSQDLTLRTYQDLSGPLCTSLDVSGPLRTSQDLSGPYSHDLTLRTCLDLSGPLWTSPDLTLTTLLSGLYDLELNFHGKHIWNANILELMTAIAKLLNAFYRFWYLISKGTIEDAVFHHFDLHFQSHAFYCYVFQIKITVYVPGRCASTRTDSAMELLLLNLSSKRYSIA